MAPRFLVDENLSVKLPEVAHQRGFEATHVVHFGLGEWQDWNILEVVEDHGWVLVTNNAVEFRSRYRAIKIHFKAALDDIAINPDLTNQALDVDLAEGSKIVVRRYALPSIDVQ